MSVATIVFAAIVAGASAAPRLPRHAQTQVTFKNDLCTLNGYSGVLVMDVPYEATSQWKCAGISKNMTMWCLPKGSSGVVFNYCCNDACDSFDVPEERYCEVDGEEYLVGQAYEDITLNGKEVTMWCTDEDTVVSCSGSQCGSTLQLTPPGNLQAKPVPPPIVKPELPEEWPQYNPDQLHNCYDCTRYGYTWQPEANKCTVRCAIQDISCITKSNQCNAKPQPPMPNPGDCGDCYTCTKNGYSWQPEANRCTGRCDIADISCIKYPSECSTYPKPPVTNPSDYSDCRSCTGAGYSWTPAANTCTGRCSIMDTECFQSPAQCQY